ncbi:ABC transporter G family member 23-like [Anoplolepis gracilipes]|uniref:ABC transporter G family member 23-like n=1 Tax=Anoplolepis gracilipes TaxID=354296 RepID=UPI003BA08F5D
MVQENAVVVKNAVKYYVQDEPILDGLNMTVSKGSIYALLGPSGCGKTILLSCIVGIKNLNKGNIWILGGHPGKPGSGIPGPRVGYMPQQISLVGEFSVSGALYYFGRINGLEDKDIDARQKFLSELLHLPPTNCLIKNISGGQQRRVSFAAALIHNPEFLILDEPTVGMDPILRENIWLYLTRITQEEGITVLITTHYIEEAKDANMIGLMRRGKLLAESSPQKLLKRFECSYLEEAFVNLCQSQNNEMNENVSEVQEVNDTEDDTLHQDEDSCKQIEGRIVEYRAKLIYNVSASKRFKALMIKNAKQFIYSYAILAFAMLFPLIQVTAFFIGIGGDPKDLTIGIINYETGNCNYGNDIGSVWYDEESLTCSFSNLSCRFLHEYGNSIANQKFYNDMSEATNAVRDGDLVGVMQFNHNFTKTLQRRINGFTYAKTEDILSNEINVFLDMGDMQIGQLMMKKLYERFSEIFEDLMKECKYPSKLSSVPIRFDAVYSDMDDGYDYFFTPTFIVTLAFFLAATLSTFLIISDRLEGVWDRSLVQGVKNREILLTHILIETILILIHITIIMCLIFPIWNLKCEGSFFHVFLLTFLSSLSGLMYGFVISVTCKNHVVANYASIGSMSILVILCGSLWPVEAMPKMIRYLCYCMPVTLPSIAMRAVIFKGYTLDEKEVYIGILVSVAYIAIFFIIVLFGLRSKS